MAIQRCARTACSHRVLAGHQARRDASVRREPRGFRRPRRHRTASWFTRSSRRTRRDAEDRKETRIEMGIAPADRGAPNHHSGVVRFFGARRSRAPQRYRPTCIASPFKSRPDETTPLTTPINHLHRSDVKTLGHYWFRISSVAICSARFETTVADDTRRRRACAATPSIDRPRAISTYVDGSGTAVTSTLLLTSSRGLPLRSPRAQVASAQVAGAGRERAGV